MSLVSGFPQGYHHHHHHHQGPGPSAEAVYVSASAAAYYPSPRYEAADFSSWTYAASAADSAAELSPVEYASCPAGSSPLYAAAQTPDYAVLSGASTGGPYDAHVVPPQRFVKRRVTANRKERRRTLSINTAFADLRDCIPNVPSDTKLSKIKTLRLATSYIAYLMDILAKDDPSAIPEGGFKAEVNKKIETREEKKKKEMANLLGTAIIEKKSKGRTGWPQHVWALELKQ